MMLPGDETIYRIAFARYPKITLDTARRFEGRGITPEEFFTLGADTLGAITNGLRSDYFDSRRRAEVLDTARQEYGFVCANSIHAIYHTDAAYPQRLAECGDAPAMLYATGHPEAAAAPHSVAIVGTRHCTHYGADFTRRLVADLAEALDGLLVVSGLAYGIDIAAHRAAIDAGVPTAAILAHGLNTIYPADHRSDAMRIVREGGFLATEYLSTDRIHRGNFLARNRLIAALADVTVVVESDIKGGAMATARLAAAYDREVMALPGRINDTYSRGCNELIATNAAALIRDASDLIELMRWTTRPQPGSQQEMHFDTPERFIPILDYVREHPGATANELCARLDIPFSRLSPILFEMEIEDYILALPGGRYDISTAAR
ncbi:MAG: DNA-processing protein DprA [Muribaculaceae bacterium]|nr:DNA-processing protein DprA [Muribaculaceae bacterium]